MIVEKDNGIHNISISVVGNESTTYSAHCRLVNLVGLARRKFWAFLNFVKVPLLVLVLDYIKN